MGIDEEIFVLRENKPTSYHSFRRVNLFLSYEDEEIFENDPIRIEEAKLIDKSFRGYWMSGKDFLRILEKLEEIMFDKQAIENFRGYYKENPVLPNDRVLYKIERV